MDNLSEWQTTVDAALSEAAVTEDQQRYQRGELPADTWFPQQELLSALDVAHDSAYRLAGQETREKKGVAFSNKATCTLLRQRKTLQRAEKELNQANANGWTGLMLQAQSICAEVDPSTPPPYEWSLLDESTLRDHL
eukprot:532863-Rhodomonas_salina.1